MSDLPAAVTYHGQSRMYLYGYLSVAVGMFLRGQISREELERHHHECQAMADAGESAMEASNE